MSNPNPPNPDPVQQAINDTAAAAKLTANGGMPLEVTLPTGEVFKGATPQELLDSLAAAKTEATRTIQAERAERRTEREELQARLTALETQARPPAAADENVKYFEKWTTDPGEAQRMLLAKELGVAPDQVIPLLRRSLENNIVNTAATEFLARCPEFPQNPETADLLRKGLEARYGKNMSAATADNLEIVYHDLVRNGRIQPQNMPISAARGGPAPIPQLTGGGAPPNQVNSILAQAQNMPLDQLKQVIDNLAAQSR